MGLRVLDRETGEVRIVDEGEAQAGLQAGRYAISTSDGPVRLRDEQGQAFEVEAQELGRTLDSGRFRLERNEEMVEDDREELYGDRPLEAGALGALSGATLGLADPMLAFALGEGRYRQLLERNEGAALTGEIVGGLAPLLMSGGTSAAGRLARTLGAPARGAFAAGEAVERGVASLLGPGRGFASRLFNRTLSTAAGGAAEGALIGGGQLVSEAALGDEQLTAEQVIAGIGLNALIGGAGTGLFGGGAALLGEGRRAFGRLAQNTRDVISRGFQQSTGRELAPGVADLYARASSVASGSDEAAIRRFIDMGSEGRAAREIVQRGDDVYEDGTRRLAEQLSAIEPTTRHVADFWGTGLKRNQVATLIDTADVSAQGRAALEALDAAQRVADDIADNPGLFTGPGGAAQGRNLRRALDARRAEIQGALARGGDDAAEAAADIYQSLDSLKRDIGRFQSRARRDPEANRMLRSLYDEQFRPLLERPDLWGEGLAEMQTEVNRSFTRWLTRRGDFERMFLAEGDRDTVDAFRRLSEADPARIAGFLRRVGTAGNERAERTFREVLEAQQDLVETMGRHMDLPRELTGAIGESRVATQRALGAFDEVSQQAATLNQFRSLTSSGEIERTVVGAAAGASLGGPLGALAAGALTSPSSAVRLLGALDRIRGQSDQAITTGVQSYLDRITRSVERAGREAGRRTRRAIPPITVAAFDEKVREYLETADPETSTRRLGERTEELSGDAPRTQAAIQTTALRGAEFVRSRVPMRSQRAHLVPGRIGQTRPSHQEMASFLRTARAVEDPLSILDELEAGRLSRESVEAVRAVYPRIYQRILEEVQTALVERAERGRPVPYRDRLQLGLLLAAPTDPSLRPEAVARLQSTYAAQAATQPPRPAASTQAPELASSLLTDTQRLEQRA